MNKYRVDNIYVTKILFTLIGLIIITFFVKYAVLEIERLREKQDFEWSEKEKLREGFDAASFFEGLGDTIKGGVESATGGGGGNPLDAIGDGIKGYFTGGINQMIGGIEDMVNGFIEFFNIIEHSIEDMQQLVHNLGNLKTGIENHLRCGAREYRDGWGNVIPILSILMQCTWEKFINFFNGECTRYYIVDIILGILRGIFIELPFAIINGMTGIDLHFITDLMYELLIVPLDGVCFLITGYHFIAWSDPVIEKCYRCKGTIKVNTGQTLTFIQPFNWWVKSMRCGIQEMNDGLESIFWSIVPNPKWGAWAQGDTYNEYGYSQGRRDGKFILDGNDQHPDPLGHYIPMLNPYRNYKNNIQNVHLPRL